MFDGKPVSVIDMPTHTITTNGKKRQKLDVHQLSEQIESLLAFIDKAILEDVHAMPKQGVSSSFSFGRVFGSIEGTLAAHKVPIEYVQPAKWKKALGLSSDKDASRRKASQLFPASSRLWPLVKHDGRAEAVLIAHYFETLCFSGLNK